MEKIEKNQAMLVSRSEYLSNILTLSEASELLGISCAYLRQLVLADEFEDWEFKKQGRVTIFLKESIENRIDKFKGRQKIKK